MESGSKRCEVLDEVDIDVDDESQIKAEQVFAQAIGQLAAQDRVETVREISTGSDQDVAAQQALVAGTDLTIYDAVQHNAHTIANHFNGNPTQYERAKQHVPPLPLPDSPNDLCQ